MEARMGNPVMVLPGAFKAMQSLSGTTESAGLSKELLELVHLRASQINGCSVCVDMHAKGLRKGGESDERLFAVAAWRDAPYFTNAERVALEFAETVTRLADRPDPVSDELWAQATKHFTEEQIAALILAIASINVWNRVNAATRQVAGAWA